jgi:hypothetical protein
MRNGITNSAVSLEGCSARMCVDAAIDETHHPRSRRDPSRSKVGRPTPRDAVTEGVCWHCGLVGEHPTLKHCIDALRERLAKLER